MRTALLAKAKPGLQISRKKVYPAPLGGWNSRDAPSSMPKTDAYDMRNMIVGTDAIMARSGSTTWSTGMTGNGKTLVTYSGLSGAQTMFAATASGIYDVTGGGAVGAAALVRTNGKHQCVLMGDGTNNWLMMFNGVDKPAYYNGSAWTAVDGGSVPALTGVTTTGLVTGMVFKGRLMLGEVNKLKFWYLAAGAVGGVLTAFDLTIYASRGGYLMAMGTWTYDGGDGQDDRAVFITSEGEVIVYQGTDPATAADWVRVGTYYFGKPLGRRCLCKYGGDLLVLTENGIIQLAKALTGVVNESQFKLSDKIRTAYTNAAVQYGSTFGWEALIYPALNVLIVNVPQSASEDSTVNQYVMNLTTGAWGYWNGMDAQAWTVTSKLLYYTRSTKVARALNNSTTDEAGGAVSAFCAPAFTNFGSPDKKQIKGVSLSVTNSGVATTIGVIPYTGYSIASSGGTTASFIAPAGVPSRILCCPAFKDGVVFSFHTGLGYSTDLGSTSTPAVSWYETEWLYEDGAGL